MSFEYPKHVSFECERCALCCGDTEHRPRWILLLKGEADRISEMNSLGLDEFAERIEGFEPYSYRMRKTMDRKCVFLKDNSCSIYRIRPLICRFYPFQLKNPGDDRYVFEYTDECPGIGKGPQLKKAFFRQLFREFTGSMSKNRESYGVLDDDSIDFSFCRIWKVVGTASTQSISLLYYCMDIQGDDQNKVMGDTDAEL